MTYRYPYAVAPGGGYFSAPFDSYKYMNGAQMFQQLSLQLSPHSSSQSSRQSCSQLSPESNSQLTPNDQNSSEVQHDKSDDFDNDNPDDSVKSINTRRKKKTNEKAKNYRCKRCDFVATSKFDFWKHNATHIRPERRLECPKCPFVTELKHHLRFHIDNHTGKKPYACTECTYSCVNKSMLKSHEKSHLDILQYRCADCSFAAKYYHSLKKHLQQLHHTAQVILNRDGTPNLLTIIDTYGTRRGPKQKPVQKSPDNKQSENINVNKQINKSVDNETLNNQLSSASIASTSTTPTTTLTTPAVITTPITTTPTKQVSPSIQNSVTTTTTPQMSPAEYVNQLAMINNALQMSPLLTLNHYMNNAFQRDNNLITNEEYAEKQNRNLQNNLLCEIAKNITNNINATEKMDDDNDINLNKISELKISTPLDLSKLESLQINNDNNEDNIPLNGKIESSQKQIDEKCNKNDDKLDNVIQQNKPSGTRKRKGKAVKLVVKKVIEEEFNDNNGMPNETPKLSNEISVPDNDSKKNINITNDKINNESIKKTFTCNYCQISFAKEVMYSLHMGFHGFNDPFHCNSCGKKYEDDVSFFLHICRSEHA